MKHVFNKIARDRTEVNNPRSRPRMTRHLPSVPMTGRHGARVGHRSSTGPEVFISSASASSQYSAGSGDGAAQGRRQSMATVLSQEPLEPSDVLQKVRDSFTPSPVFIIADAIATLSMDPQKEVKTPAQALFDMIFNSRLYEDQVDGPAVIPAGPAAQANITNNVQQSSTTSPPRANRRMHRTKSQFFKYSLEYWLRKMSRLIYRLKY